MKKIKGSAAWFFGVFLLTLSLASAGERLEIGVNGMVCDFCSQSIQKNFKKLDQVKNVEVNLDQKWVRLEFKKDQKLSEAKIKEVIQDAGYDVRDIKSISSSQ